MKNRLFHIVVIAVMTSACQSESSKRPSSTLVSFTREMAQKNLVSDHSRIVKKEIYDLDQAEVQYIDGRPFYRIEAEENSLYKAAIEDGAVTGKVKGIWTYYYREEDAILIIPDGVIEQWDFPNEETAAEAIPFLQQASDEVFPKTTPYICQHKNSIYVFHARSTNFSDNQKAVFEDFLKKTEAYVED